MQPTSTLDPPDDSPVQHVTIPYTPRLLQGEIHQKLDEHRWAALVLHRRFGKTVMLLNQLLKRALMCDKERPRFGYIAPYLKQAKTVAWDYIKYYVRDIPGCSINESELRVDLPNGARIRLFGSDNPDALRGIYLDGVVLDEYQDSDPRVFSSILRPALSDRHGWAVFCGTPNGKNHFYDMVQQVNNDQDPHWYTRVLKASDTGILTADELDDAKKIMSEEEYMREYECSFDNAVVGSYYGAYINAAYKENRIGNVPHDPALPVITSWDLGMGDATSIWFFQKFQNEIRVIDYYEASGEGMAFYVKILNAKPYNYEQHIMPHDIRVRELGTGKSRYEVALSLGIKPITIARQLPLEDGIEASRNMLPKCWFDKKKCAQGIYALQDYHKEWDEMRKEFKNKPFHDHTSHAADSWRYMAVGYVDKKAPKPVSSIMTGYNFKGAW